MSATAEKRQLARAMFWPDVIEEIAIILDDATRTMVWDGAVFSCLDSNGFPSSAIERYVDSEYRPRAVKAFLDFVRNTFELVEDDELDAG